MTREFGKNVKLVHSLAEALAILGSWAIAYKGANIPGDGVNALLSASLAIEHTLSVLQTEPHHC